MKRPILLAMLAVTATFAAAPVAFISTAEAQVPPRYGAYGDRDRDGIPNRYDNYDNRRTWNQRAWGDRDHDGIPNAYDKDRDGDGVRNNRDAAPNNPTRY